MQETELITRTIALATALGLNIADACKSFKKQVNETYDLSLLKKRKLSNVLDTDLFIWAWAVAYHYGTLFFVSKDRSAEASVYQAVLSDYFHVVCTVDNSFEIFEFWTKYAHEVSIMDEEGHTGNSRTVAIMEKLANMLSLRVFKYVHSDVFQLGLEEINETWGRHIVSVRENLEFAGYQIVDVIYYYINEAEESTVQSAFDAVRHKEPVASLIKKWKSDQHT